MKAVVYTEYGPPSGLQVKEVEKPTPADDEVLIKLVAVSLNRSDWETLIGKPLYSRIRGLRKPGRHILGSDIAGRVEEVGKDVTRFKPGDAVFGDILSRMGGFAEYVCAREKSLAPIPSGLTFEQAAAIPQSAVIALQGIRDKGQVRAGQKVLINGAGGGSGMFAIQLAKSYGAEVTAVDNTEKQAFMRSLGADHVIDYTRQNFTKNKKQYHLILDMITYRSVFAYRRALKRNGNYYAVGGSMGTFLQMLLFGPLIKWITGKRIWVLAVQPNLKDMLYMAELCQAGTIVAHIDRCFALSEVPQALQYLGDGHAKGKVIITMENGDQQTEAK